MLEEIPLNLKLKLKSKTPPAHIRFIPIGNDPNQMLEVYWSLTIKEPREGHCHGHKIKVSSFFQF